MALLDRVQEELGEALNVGDRSPGHVAFGVLLCAGAVAATAIVAVATPRQAVAPGAEPTREPIMRAVWPALFSLTTLAALRLWNAPPSVKRTQALRLWGLSQGVNLLWMLLRPRDSRTQVLAAVSMAGITAVYAHVAAAVDQKAASIVAPTGFAGLSAIVAKPPGPQ